MASRGHVRPRLATQRQSRGQIDLVAGDQMQGGRHGLGVDDDHIAGGRSWQLDGVDHHDGVEALQDVEQREAGDLGLRDRDAGFMGFLVARA